MKITSLLTEDKVLEHLGNLDAVDKELVSKLVVDVSSYAQQRNVGWKKDVAPASGDTRGAKKLDTQAYAGFSKKGQESWEKVWHGGDERKTNRVSKLLGRGSELEERTVTAEEALQLLAEDPKYVALIYKHAGKQALIITHSKYANAYKKYSSDAKPTKAVTAAESVFTWKMTKAFQKLIPWRKVKSTATTMMGGEDAFKKALKLSSMQTEGQMTLASVKALLLTLAKFEFNEQHPDETLPKKDSALPKLNVTLVTVDEKRGEAHAQRKAARKKQVPTPRTPVKVAQRGVQYKVPAYDAHVKGLADSLAYKLNAIRNANAADFADQEEMLKHVIDKGYLNKVNYLGETYNLDTQNHIDYTDLMLGKKSQEKSYIGYKREAGDMSWSDPRLKAAYAELDELRKSMHKDAPPRPEKFSHYRENDLPEGPERDKFLDEQWVEAWARDKASPKTAEIMIKHKIPPNELKVKLMLEGGKIVPFMVELIFR